nr:MAG TPA_asm: hypothetical protein [Bacteriophage sp.]
MCYKYELTGFVLDVFDRILPIFVFYFYFPN